MDWKNTLQWFPIWLLLGGATFAQDSDNDGIPDAWETANYMNPDSSYDAAVDFDRDGLTSLQEYQLSLLGKGTGVKGKWSAILVDLSGMTSGSEDLAAKVIAINDEDDVLVNLEGRGSPGSVSSAWVRKGTDGTWKQLTTVNGSPATISGRDLNDNGQVVGEARAVGVNGGNSFGFIKDLKELPLNTDVTPWFSESDSVTPVRTITAINDWGDVMGRRADWTSFFQSGFYGDVSPPGAWSSTLFTAINNWGQALGIEYSDPNYGMGLWSHFLLSEGWASLIPFPGVFSEYDLPEFGGEEWELMGLQEISYNPSLINDWGEYAGRYSVTGGEEGEDGYEEIMSGYWYYDGLDHGASPAYRQLLPWNYKWQVIHALNNWPQMIVSGTRIAPYAPDPGEPQEYFPKETFLMVEPMRVPLSAIAPDPTVLTQSSFKLIDINNRSTILGSLYNKIYLLKLNQDADGDRIPDDWEEFYGMDPLDPSDARDDNDGDGFSNLSEYQFGGNPSDDQIGESVVDGELRDRLDTDADGLPDAWERKFFPNSTLAQVAVTDNDDYDWLTNGQEWQLGTDPTKRDTDEDGLSDSSEVNSYFTNPANPDTDGDGLVDGDERRIGTNALDPASTGAPPTFLNIAEKVTTSTYAGYQFWANWRYTGPEIHEGSPECGEYASSHAGFAYPALSGDNPVTMLYPEGEMPEINPDKCTPASPYNTDGFLGGGIPWNTCGSLRSWKVRAERKTPHPSIATQAWLVVESDLETDTVQDIRALQLEIDANEKVSNETEEIKPGGQGRKVRLFPVEVITDMNNDGQITLADNPLRDAAMASGATDEIKDKGTEFIFHNDTLSNGIWDKEDADPARPTTEEDDDDAEEILIKPGITEGEVWLDHPAIAGLSFYKTRKCNAADKVNLSPPSKFNVSPSNPFPDRLFMRVDGELSYAEANPQLEGDLVLKVKANGKEAEAFRMKLTVVKQLGAKTFFRAARDYILERNTKMLARNWEWPINAPTTRIRMCVMLEEVTTFHPMETYNFIADPEAPVGDPVAHGLAGIESVINFDQEMTVVINGNQCGFSNGMGTAEAYLAFLLGEPEMTDKCQGRVIVDGILSIASNDHYDPVTNAPGTSMKGSYLAGPDPIPETSGPGGKYFAQYPDGKFRIGTGRMPANFGPPGTIPQTPLPDNGIGGLSGDYELGERANYPNSMIGYHPMRGDGKGVVFAACGLNFTSGNGKVPEFYDAAKSSDLPEIPGATIGAGRTRAVINLLLLDSGNTSPAFAHQTPGGNLKLLLKGSKHNGNAYYTNTFLRFKSARPRN